MKRIIIISALLIGFYIKANAQESEIPYSIEYRLTDQVENQYDTLVEVIITIYSDDYDACESIDLDLELIEGGHKKHNIPRRQVRGVKDINLQENSQIASHVRQDLQFFKHGKTRKSEAIRFSLGTYNLTQTTSVRPQFNKKTKGHSPKNQ